MLYHTGIAHLDLLAILAAIALGTLLAQQVSERIDLDLRHLETLTVLGGERGVRGHILLLLG